MDLAENLNEVRTFKNLLIVQDVLTDFLLLFPMKSKTSRELINLFMYSIIQNFNVKRVHSDNGPAFRNKEWLKLMAALNVKVINSSANNPQARGKAERAVQLVKTTMKKILATASSGSLN
jgi:transposase InsO family protein